MEEVLLGNIKGEKGEKGEQGLKGEQGVKGEQGEKGEKPIFRLEPNGDLYLSYE